MLDFSDYPIAEKVFRYFEEISKIPRGSGNTALIADYLQAFAKMRSLEFYRDGKNNILIKKPASKGYEERPTVIIQGHTDMVAEKEPTCDKNLLTEGIDIYRDGDYLKARGTTLGGDDGIAVAYALALLDSEDIPHPAIEALFTSDEEIGLLGADAFDKSRLTGRIMINIDTDDEGIFVAGCAGGVRTDIRLPVYRGNFGGEAYSLKVSGLIGGHSGVEINRGRGNAIKIGFRVLSCLGDIRLHSAEGGNMDNAIPREFSAIFFSDEDFERKFSDIKKDIAKEYADTDSGIKIEIVKTKVDTPPCDKETTEKILGIVNSIPFGPVAYLPGLDNMVETSLNSGIARLGDEFTLCTSLRSSSEDKKWALAKKLEAVAEKWGAEFSWRGAYPGWEYRKNSKIRDVCSQTFFDLYGREAEVITIHAGLECGLFTGEIPDLDCISFGPDNFDIHTTEERLSLSSCARVWDFLLEVLKRI